MESSRRGLLINMLVDRSIFKNNQSTPDENKGQGRVSEMLRRVTEKVFLTLALRSPPVSPSYLNRYRTNEIKG